MSAISQAPRGPELSDCSSFLCSIPNILAQTPQQIPKGTTSKILCNMYKWAYCDVLELGSRILAFRLKEHESCIRVLQGAAMKSLSKISNLHPNYGPIIKAISCSTNRVMNANGPKQRPK